MISTDKFLVERKILRNFIAFAVTQDESKEDTFELLQFIQNKALGTQLEVFK